MAVAVNIAMSAGLMIMTESMAYYMHKGPADSSRYHPQHSR